jgi:hypothetical protein
MPQKAARIGEAGVGFGCEVGVDRGGHLDFYGENVVTGHEAAMTEVWSGEFNAVRLVKTTPFALSLSKGWMHHALRQAQGERGVNKSY